MIRPYQDRDLDDVLSAWIDASRVAHPFLTEDFLAQERRDLAALYLPNANTWVVEVDDEVVGFISLVGNEVAGLFLKPDYHGQKLGKLMMDKAQELHGDLEVEVFENNPIGRRFYAQYGFIPIEAKVHEQTGERLIRLRFTAQKV
jgi:putative acetyltransferase